MTSFASTALEWLVGMTLWTGVLVVMARLADAALAPRVSARVRIALYVAVFARLALPLRWAGGWTLVDVARVVPSASAMTWDPPGMLFVPAGEPVAEAFPWAAALGLGVYAAGVATLLVCRWVAHRRLVAGLRPARPAVAALSPAMPVFESDDAGPLVLGALRSRIVIPSRVADSLDAAGLAWIVRHERSHVALRDPLLLGALQLVVALLWPIVPLWFALRRIRTLIEVACDERTLASSTEVERRGFMRVLATVAETQSRRVRLAGPLAFDGDVVERLRSLATASRRWPVTAQTAVVLALGAGLVACASSETDARDVAEFLSVKVTTVPNVEATGFVEAAGRIAAEEHAPGPDRSIGVRMVESRLLAGKTGEDPSVTAWHGSAQSDGSGTLWIRSPRHAGAEPDRTQIVAAPTLIAFDGSESSLTLDWRQDQPDAAHCLVKYKIAPATDGGFDLSVTFEQRTGGELVRTIGPATIRVAEGETYLVATQRPAAPK